MPTGMTPIAMAASALPQPEGHDLLRLLVISVLPKAWSIVTASKPRRRRRSSASSPPLPSARAPQAVERQDEQGGGTVVRGVATHGEST